MLSMGGKMITLHVDNSRFYISPKTLDDHKKTVLYRAIINNETDPRVFISRKGDLLGSSNLPEVYIDADDDSFKYIVSYLRGYQDDRIFNSNILKGKVYYDAKYFKIDGLVNILDQYDSSSKMYSDAKNLTDTMSYENKESPKSTLMEDLLGGGTEVLDLDSLSDTEELVSKEDSMEKLSEGHINISSDSDGSVYSPLNDQLLEDSLNAVSLNTNEPDKVSNYESDDSAVLSDDIDIEKILNISSEKKAEIDEYVKSGLYKSSIVDAVSGNGYDGHDGYDGSYQDNSNDNELNGSTGNNQYFDTSVLLADDKSEINGLINTIQNRLKSPEAFNVMHMLSTDKNITKLLKSYNDRVNSNIYSESSFAPDETDLINTTTENYLKTDTELLVEDSDKDDVNKTVEDDYNRLPSSEAN